MECTVQETYGPISPVFEDVFPAINLIRIWRKREIERKMGRKIKREIEVEIEREIERKVERKIERKIEK